LAGTAGSNPAPVAADGHIAGQEVTLKQSE
jgi:hypothetical protein